jgi:molybdopterin/thiamine biosynthesis adenylyltransferase
VGAGAIGNGVVYLLSRLPTAGRVAIVDSQEFGYENLGTCLLIGPADIGTEKATFAASVLRPSLTTDGFAEDLASFAERFGPPGSWRPIVISALDSIDARYAVQALWPDLIVDGAIGDFGCQVSRHRWGEDTACLMCLFRHPPGEPAELVASRASGLRIARVVGDTEVVTEEDVRHAPPHRQEWLHVRLGRPICSVVQEAIAQQLSLEAQRAGFEPSVPFVACLSASMVVAELVKFQVGWLTPLEPRFQLDILRGPALGQLLPQARRSDCVCTTRPHNIEKVRRARRSGSTLCEGGQ